MRNPIFRLSLIALLLPFAAGAAADSLLDGDAEAGKAKSVTCSACHGAEGISVNPLWPNLAGQGARYTAEQLKAFKEGKRVNALMSAQAMGLSDQDMRDLAVYYESLTPPAQPVANVSLIDRAEALYRGGNTDEGIAACIACHGPAGRGNPAAAYPALNGQHAAYTAKTLNDYASGARKSGGPTMVMQSISARLSAEDIEALAAYVQGLK